MTIPIEESMAITKKASVGPWGPKNDAMLEKICMAGAKVASAIHLQAYYVAVGTGEITLRFKVTAKGFKAVCHLQKARTLAAVIIGSTISKLKLKTFDLYNPNYIDENFVNERVHEAAISALEMSFDFQALLDEAAKNPVGREAALEQLQKNRGQRDLLKLQHALRHLSEVMSTYAYTKEDVLEAWEMAQVAKVMEA